MMLHGGPCPKPTICWSNDEHVVDGLDRGPAFYCYIIVILVGSMY